MAITCRRFGTTYPSHFKWSRSPGRKTFFPAHARRQKGTEEIVSGILNLGTRCRCVVTGIGTHCVGPVAVHKAFMGVLEEKIISCPPCESNHESLVVDHADQPLHRMHCDGTEINPASNSFYIKFFLPSSCFSLILWYSRRVAKSNRSRNILLCKEIFYAFGFKFSDFSQ